MDMALGMPGELLRPAIITDEDEDEVDVRVLYDAVEDEVDVRGLHDAVEQWVDVIVSAHHEMCCEYGTPEERAYIHMR
jgi:hypothetical protein